MKIRISIADDHPLIRTGLKSLLQTQEDIEILGTYSGIRDLVHGLEKALPDVLLLDLQLSDGNADNILPELKSRYPALKVLVLTSNDNIYNVRLVLNRGADGYLLKNSEQEQLADTIRDVFHGYNTDKILSSEIAGTLTRTLAKDPSVLVKSNQLSPRELEVLQLIARELTSQEIGAQLHLSARTVESYRLLLMQKLGVRNMVGMVKKAILLGLITE